MATGLDNISKMSSVVCNLNAFLINMIKYIAMINLIPAVCRH